MTIGIYTNLDKDHDLEATNGVIALLQGSGISCFLHEKMRSILPGRQYFDKQHFDMLDMIVSIGGDGTMLGIVGEYSTQRVIPLIGVNKGRLGFLNEIDPQKLHLILDIVRDKKFVEDKRQLLEVKVGGQVFYGLNEVILYRNNEAKIINMDVRVQGQLVDRYNCDGFIVATPTGSTAYSLSAGGPVVSPYSQVSVLTPINSHTLRSRPIVVSSRETVELILNKNSEGARVLVDGAFVAHAGVGEPVVVFGSDKYATFYRRANDFYAKLLSKLNILGTTETT